jgi:hypothetical protein
MQLTYLNYKQPLKAVEDGFGYLGTLAQTEDKQLVQCHICGELCANLGIHAYFRHGMKALEYRTKFQLGRTTPLCSDAWSEKCKQSKIKMWEALSGAEKEARRELMRQAQQKTKRVGNPRSLESLNKDGMCPDQLIEKIQDLEKKLNHSPSHAEFVTEYGGKYTGAITRTFGTWNGAKKMAGLLPCKSGSKVPHNKSRYSNDVLLEFLRTAYKEKGVVPTYSDWKKGFLPSYYLYQHRFGSIVKARQLAGIE